MPLDPIWTPPTQEDYKAWAEFLVNPRGRVFNDQSSTVSQLMDLVEIAQKIGKYDARDYLKQLLTSWE